MIRVAINGYGRIGRCVLRALHERADMQQMQVIAINEPADLATMCYLTRYDTTHGRFPGSVEQTEESLVINGETIQVSHKQRIEDLPWRDLQIDLVLECSGAYDSRPDAEKLLANGAKKLLFSHPAVDAADATIVYGINHHQLGIEDRIVSNASCTTNCIVPVIAVLDETFGIEAGQITTIHSVMNDQPVIDAYHNTDLRKTRSASQSVIPIETQLAKGIERILPHTQGRFSAGAIRVPTTNVSIMDLSVWLAKEVTSAAINAALREASEQHLNGVLGYTEEPLASCDFNHDPRSGVVDAGQTRVSGGRLAKVFTWFDNEWGFANRMLDVAALMTRQ